MCSQTVRELTLSPNPTYVVLPYHTTTITTQANKHNLVFKVPFEGFRPIIHAPFFQESDYQFLAAGEIITSTWDIGQVHDLSFGGNFTLYSEGFIPVVDRNGDITFPNPAPYRSNVLGISVDGPSAANVRHSLGFQAKRHVVQPDCTPTQLKQMNTALMLCASRAAAASAAAASGPPEKMLEYFKSDDPFTRSTVAAVFERAAAECRDGMSVKQHCIDVNQKCRSDAHLAYTDEKHLAYTNKKENIIGTCPAFWRLPSNLGDCRHADMGLVALHEATHLVHVGDTVDFACYDYGCAVEQLGAGQLLRHAQTYALFAQCEFSCPRMLMCGYCC